MRKRKIRKGEKEKERDVQTICDFSRRNFTNFLRKP